MRQALIFIASALFSSAAMAQVGAAGAGARPGANGIGAAGIGAGAAGGATALPGPAARTGAAGPNTLPNAPTGVTVTNNANPNYQLFNSQGPAVTTFNNAFTRTPGGTSFGFAGQPGAANPFAVTGAGQTGAIPITVPQGTITTITGPSRVFDFSTNNTSLNSWLAGGNPSLNANQQVP